MASILFACQEKQEKSEAIQKTSAQKAKFEYLSEEFDDIKILRYQFSGFEKLSVKKKKYVYCFDIKYDERGCYRYKIWNDAKFFNQLFT